MPLPTSQPTWSPNMGLNLLNSLPRLSNGALPGLNPPVSGHLGVPEPGFLAEETRGLASVMAFGSIPIQNQLFRPFSPRFGCPNRHEVSQPQLTNAENLVSSPFGLSNGFGMESGRPATGHTKDSVSPHSSLRSSHSAEVSIHSNRRVVMPRNLAGTREGLVWVPDKRTTVNGPVLTYRHDTSHPPWSSARELNGLDHRSDPLPWCRDGSNPVDEAAASAEYNMYVLRQNEATPSSGEDECLRHLLAGPDEEQVTPGLSVDRLLSAHGQVLPHTSSPGTHQELHEVDELDEGEGSLINSSLQTSKSVSASVAGGSTRGRISHPRSNNSDSEQDGEVTPVNSAPKKKRRKSKKKATSPTRFRWSNKPDELDYIFLSHLGQFEPFAVARDQVERFYQCTLHLKNHPDTRDKFGLITANRQTRTLKNRYDQLKAWLPTAERVSACASGAQEVDEDQRVLLNEFINKEKELEVATLAAREAKEAAATSLARAEDLRNEFSGRDRSRAIPAGMTEEEVALDDEVGHPPANSIRAIRHKLDQKLEDRGTGAHMVEVTMKSSEAQERANEIALMGLERHEQQTNVVNLQRERELAQAQARLDLDSQMGRDTLALRREELAAATSRKEKTKEHIDELKSSVSNVQGTLAEMGSVLKLLVERIPGTNPS